MILDENFWEERWKNGRIGWDIGYPSPPICRLIDRIENKKTAILIPGCGNAHEAEYLIEKGFENITLLDISATAVQIVSERFKEFPQVRVVHQDFFVHEGQYDYILEQTFFCTFEPQIRPDYVQKMYDLLKPGGRLEGLLFGIEFGWNGPPFGGERGRYISLFSKLFEITEINITNESIKPRLGNELKFVFVKKI